MKGWMAIIYFLWSASAWAAGDIQIESDSMRMDNQQQRATFIGHVFLTRDDFELHCDQLIVSYIEHSIIRAVASGHVRMQQGVRHASSDNAVFEKVANRVTLTGHASVQDEQGVLQGYKIIHDISQGSTEVLQQKGKSVHLHINEATTQGTTP